MNNTPPSALRRLGQRLSSSAFGLLTVSVLAALAVPNRAVAGPFAATSLSPSTQTVNVGTPFTVNVVYAIGSNQYGLTHGLDLRIAFDPTKLQVVSVATGSGSPFTTPVAGKNVIDNATGFLRYGATGPNVANVTYTAAQIVFMPIAAGSSSLRLHEVRQYFSGYGPFGIDGSAVGGSVTINAPLPTQTLTILGGSGSAGGVAANVEYYNPATGNWQPAYLTGWHPWGFVSGTDSWINYKTSNASDAGAGPAINQTLWFLYRVRFTVPSDAVNPKMTFSLKADNVAQVAINGVTVGGSTIYINNANMENVIWGTTDQFNADAVFSQAVRIGENIITLNVGDFGGLNGFNFRIDLSMESSQPLVIVPIAPADTTPPVITAPVSLTAEATSAAGAVVTFTATANDAVSGAVNVVASPASGSTFPLGLNSVGLAAADAAGNTATASFTVTVRDTIAPALAVPGNRSAEATSASGAAVTYPAATATDAVGVTSLIYSNASGATFALGNTTVNVTAADAATNATTKSFTVSVVDTTAPALTVPASRVLEATSAAGVVATFAATATDAVGVTSVTYSAASGSTFALGTTTVTVTAKDAAGNTSTGSFTITVRDTTAPAITSLSNNSPTLWPPNHKMVAVTVAASSTDIVGVASLKIVSVTSSEPDNGLGDGDTANDIQVTGNLTVNLRAERSGGGNGRTYTITVEAKDDAGNATTKTTTAFVPKSQSGK